MGALEMFEERQGSFTSYNYTTTRMKTLTQQVASDIKDEVKLTYTQIGAQFSPCGKYRYLLYRIWDTTLPYAMCVGLNPSTANGVDDDPTIRNLSRSLSKSGYGGLYMVNLFAFITADPDKLRECPNPIQDNDIWIQTAHAHCEDVIFAWGSFRQARYRAKEFIRMFPDALCFGKTAKGKPIHPLAATVWMKSKCKLQRFIQKLT